MSLVRNYLLPCQVMGIVHIWHPSHNNLWHIQYPESKGRTYASIIINLSNYGHVHGFHINYSYFYIIPRMQGKITNLQK